MEQINIFYCSNLVLELYLKYPYISAIDFNNNNNNNNNNIDNNINNKNYMYYH